MSSMMLDHSVHSLNNRQGQNVVTLPVNLLGAGDNVCTVSMQDRVDLIRANAQSANAGPKKIQPQIVELLPAEEDEEEDLYCSEVRDDILDERGY